MTQPVLCLIGHCDDHLWGRALPERTALQFSRAGITGRVSPDKLAEAAGDIILVRADAVLDVPLVAHLAGSDPVILLSGEGEPLAARLPAGEAETGAAILAGETELSALPDVPASAPAGLGAEYWQALRKRETPYAYRYRPQQRDEIEWRIFMGTYKGATDIVTKHVWPRPAFYVTRWLAPGFVTPNMVTSVSALFTVLAFYFFMQGEWLPGLFSAWAMTFLDTVDGKLARTTLTSSAWGNVFDHGIDLVHPPFWYWAWAAGLSASGHQMPNEFTWWVLAVIIGGYVLQRVVEGASISVLGLEIHIWRRIDSLFRQITARRNPNLIILTLGALFGRPDLGLIAVAVWTALCFVLHLIQLTYAFYIRVKHGPLNSWLTKPDAET